MPTFLARRYDSEQVVEVSATEGGLTSVRPASQGSMETAAGLPRVGPALVDLQVNGLLGRDFTSPASSTEDIAFITRELARWGVAGFCPTVVTHSFAIQRQAVKNIAQACNALPEVARAVLGIHLEGPYLSPLDGPRGAHAKEHCRVPNWDEFRQLQDAARGRIALVTLAPELPQALEFIRLAVGAGVVVAIGHTAASGDQIRAAVEAGARLSTHLGNGCQAMLPRHPNVIWDQLADDRLHASFIADGRHVPPHVLKCLVRAKTPARCLLVSDLASPAGLPPGKYSTVLGETEVLGDGSLVVAGQRQYLAGAASPLYQGVFNLMQGAELDLATVVRMASHAPRELLGLPSWELVPQTNFPLALYEPPGEFKHAGKVSLVR